MKEVPMYVMRAKLATIIDSLEKQDLCEFVETDEEVVIRIKYMPEECVSVSFTEDLIKIAEGRIETKFK